MLDVARFQTNVVRGAYEYWARKTIDGRLPRRSDIRPDELRALLPYVFLVDVAQAPLGFRFRLVGSAITTWAEKEYTGLAVDARDYGADWKRVFDIYAGVVAAGQPRRDVYKAPWVSREFLRYERVVAPLSSDGKTVDMLFGALQVLEREPRTGR